MFVKVLKEEGHELALQGMAYSYKDRKEDTISWWNSVKNKAFSRAKRLAFMQGGHNKFLESISVWIDIEAPRSFWSEFDTYRVGITKQSESTMHTLSKRPPETCDFEEGTLPEVISTFVDVWKKYRDNITILKENLPEGYLQRRLICTNYKSLQNINYQRLGHRYKRWDTFLKAIKVQLEYPEYIFKDEYETPMA